MTSDDVYDTRTDANKITVTMEFNGNYVVLFIRFL